MRKNEHSVKLIIERFEPEEIVAYFMDTKKAMHLDVCDAFHALGEMVPYEVKCAWTCLLLVFKEEQEEGQEQEEGHDGNYKRGLASFIREAKTTMHISCGYIFFTVDDCENLSTACPSYIKNAGDLIEHGYMEHPRTWDKMYSIYCKHYDWLMNLP